MPRRDVLASAIQRAGSVKALAKLIGVSASAVQGWQRRGVSARGKAALEGLKVARKATAVAAKERKAIFDELLKLSGERGDLPDIRTSEGERNGPRTSGYYWTKRIAEMLTPGLVKEIAAWLTSKRRRGDSPVFQAVAVVSEYTKQDFRGYKTVMKPVEGRPEAGDFAIEEQLPTAKNKSLAVVRDELLGKLEDFIDGDVLVLVHAVTLYNYRMRTEAQRMAWESGRRRKRWKKKQKKQRGASKKSPALPSENSSKKAKTKATKSPSKNVYTLLQLLPSSKKRASAKASPAKKSKRHSRPATSRKSSTKQRFSSAKKTTRKAKTSAATARKKTTKKTSARKTRSKATKKGRTKR